MKMKIQISEILILLGLMAGVTSSFLQDPLNQFQSTFNSTILTGNGKLYRPIVIPNLTELSEHSYLSKPNLLKIKTNDNAISKNILQNDLSRESTHDKIDFIEEYKPSENRFSSRYSSKEEPESIPEDSEETAEEKATSITDIPILLERGEPISAKITLPSPPNPKAFSDRSDIVDDSDEEKVIGHQYPDSIEAKEREESEIASTTNEPYSELRTPTSIRTSPDEHFENYETSSGVSDEIDDSEEDDKSEEKRSLNDYHNSGSKNYHSIQTPLNQIEYRGPHSFRDEFDSQKIKETTPSRLRLIKHNWPYNRKQLKTDFEENEISDEEENEKLESEEWSDEGEPKSVILNTKETGLEQAVHKDENRFNRNRTHNYTDDRRRRKQQEKNLAKEEEKDFKSPFYKVLKQYTVEEEEPNYQQTSKLAKVPKEKHYVQTSTTHPAKKPKNIFFNYSPSPTVKPPRHNNSKELALDFPIHQFLGPIVFDKDSSKIQTTPITHPKITQTYKLTNRNYVSDLERKEKLDQEKLTNQRYAKAVFADEERKYESFNHLEESDEMYNAILANIQSVFGLRTQPLKAGGNQKNQAEAYSIESSALTWSAPLIKRQIKAHQGGLGSVTLKGSDNKVKSGSESTPAYNKSIFPTDITQTRNE